MNDNNMNNDFYNNNENQNNNDNFYQFKPTNDNNQNNGQSNNINNNNQSNEQNNNVNNNSNSNNDGNIYQFKTSEQSNQSNGSDPAGIANDYLKYIPGNIDEELIQKVFKMPTRLLVNLIIMGVMTLVGIILLIIGLGGDDPFVIIGISFIAMGVSFSLIFIPTLLRNNKMNKLANPDILRSELSMPYYYLAPAKTYFTEHYLISIFTNKIIARYTDIVWVYDEIRTQNNQGGLIGAALQSAINMRLGNTNIVVVLTDKKKYRFPSCDQVDSVFDIIQSQNEKVIVGKDKAAKARYKEIKNGLNPNAMSNQMNNMPQNNNSDSNNNVYR